MSKYDYFGALESLAHLCAQAVRLTCGGDASGSFSEIRRACDRTVCAMEDALFSDFLPPLERDSIAACAHGLSRVIHEASELLPESAEGLPNEEGAICIRLVDRLAEAVVMLRRITHPDQTPDTAAFRALLQEGRHAHERVLSAIRQGTLPRSAATTVIRTGRLRAELSLAYDCVIEVMLDNI